jgi:hypothetical protein
MTSIETPCSRRDKLHDSETMDSLWGLGRGLLVLCVVAGCKMTKMTAVNVCHISLYIHDPILHTCIRLLCLHFKSMYVYVLE